MDAVQGPPTSRRGVLAGLTGLALAGLTSLTATGCTTTDRVAGAAPASVLTRDDVRAAGAAAARATALALAYQTASQRHPSLRPLFDVLRSHHEDHVRALEARVPAAAGPPTARASPARGATGPPETAGRTTSAVTVDESPLARAGTLAALTKMENEASMANRTACLRVGNGLAPLVGSVCAAESAHADLLTGYAAALAAGPAGAPAGAR